MQASRLRSRDASLKGCLMDHYETDLLIIGGGINGTGIAADAAGRGLSVMLCEQGDLASATSSASTKLIHGGLRYLEQFEFKLVHDALKEREILLKKAPHLIHPLAFILPYKKQLRPAWLLQIGLFFYDHLARRLTLPRSQKLNLRQSIEGKPLKKEYETGFRYYDCFCDDARLVIANAQAARDHGATIVTRTRCINTARHKDSWQVELEDLQNNTKITVSAKAVINATGPWVNQTLKTIFDLKPASEIQLVKGSHIVVPKLYDGDHAYILQASDQRVVFTIPFQQQFTLVGTTDVALHHDPTTAKITEEEITYLCQVVNDYFHSAIDPNKIIWSYAGVRPLYGLSSTTPSKISRDYHFEMIDHDHQTPLLSIYGGKITTFRTLAEHALEKLKPYFSNMKESWTATAVLPGW